MEVVDSMTQNSFVCYYRGSIFHYLQEHGLEGELMSLALLSSEEDMMAAAKYVSTATATNISIVTMLVFQVL